MPFVKNAEDFENWFRFFLTSLFGDPELTPNEEEVDPDDESQSTSEILKNYGTLVNNQKLMMHSNYIMGMRLKVVNASKKSSAGTYFEGLQDTILQNAAFYNYDTATDDVINHTAFESFSDINTHGDDGHFVQFYPGSMTLEEAHALYDQLFAREVITEDLLTMRLEMLTYSVDASLGNLIRVDVTQSNSGQYYSEAQYLNFAPTHNGSSTEQKYIRLTI